MMTRDRRALTLGGVVLVGAVLTLRILPWGIRSLRAADRELGQRASLLARTRGELAEAGALGDSAAALTRALAGLAPKLVGGETSADAAADLAGRVTALAAQHHVRVDRVDPLPAVGAAGRLRPVGVRVGIEGDLRGVAGLLQGLANGPTAVALDALHLMARDPGGAGQGPEVLQGDVSVRAWYLPRAGPP